MYFFAFRSRPKPENENKGKHGGAYINCWIDQHSREEAEEIARQYIGDSGWIVEAKEEDRSTYEEDYAESKDGLEYYQKAQKEGSCFVFHTWPIGLDENE
jgi:hypothetical protein